MDTNHPIEAYDYVNHPYEQVRAALVANPLQVFRRATSAAAFDDAVLKVDLGVVEVGAEIVIEVVRVDEIEVPTRCTALALRWHASRNAAFFPVMSATLRVFPLTPTETQLALEGTYTTPLGVIGDAIDAMVGHDLAVESTSRFIAAVAAWLREELVTPAPIHAQPAPAQAVDAEC